MPLPVDYDTVPVRGKYVYLDGTPASGQIRFTGKVIATSASTDTIIIPATITATLDENGEFAINIPATDDEDISPSGWTYTVEEKLAAGGGRIYDIDVPLAAKTDGIDLSSVAPLLPSSGDPTAFVTLSVFHEHVHEGGGEGGGSGAWEDITGKPSSYPPSVHTHVVSDVNDLQIALDAKQDAGDYASSSHTHSPSDVGLGNVDNTSDAAKPVSTAQQTALDGKLSLSRTLSSDPGNSAFLRTNLTYAVSSTSSDIEQIRVNNTNVSWRNEVGFLRGTPHPGYKDDALVRGVPRSDVTTNGGFLELENAARTTQLWKRSWKDGSLWRSNGSAAAIQMADVLVLSSSASVPAGTPTGTVIVRLA